MKKTIALSGVVVLSLGCWLAAAPRHADSKDAADQEVLVDHTVVAFPFNGRIIVVGSKSDPEAGAVLEDAKVKQLGNRYFLVGTGADSGHPEDWMKGKVTWVAIDEVVGLTEFANLDEYNKTAADNARDGAKESRN